MTVLSAYLDRNSKKRDLCPATRAGGKKTFLSQRIKKMSKSFLVLNSTLKTTLLFWVLTCFVPYLALWAQQADTVDRETLAKSNAYQALEIANQWHWSHPEINSYITPREIVFKFPDGHIIKIPLPEDKMMVAVAPYIKQTHT
jgi:hypothetical protein